MEENQTTIVPHNQKKVKGKVEINIQRCKGCELCAIECKEGALFIGDVINNKGYRYILANNDLCTGCTNCALVCPDAVITVHRTKLKKPKSNVNVVAGESIKEIVLSNQ